MILRNYLRDCKSVLRLTMFFLLLFFVATRLPNPATDFWEGVADGVRGALFGITFGLNVWAVMLAGRQRRDGGCRGAEPGGVGEEAGRLN